jgi:hypothetical protein
MSTKTYIGIDIALYFVMINDQSWHQDTFQVVNIIPITSGIL